jgi:hypothetical protein
MNHLRGIERHLQNDISAGRVTNNVRARNPETLHEEPAMCRMLRNTHLPRHSAAARTADAVIVHERAPPRQDRLSKQRREPICEDAGMNQENWLAVSMDLVLEFNIAK